MRNSLDFRPVGFRSTEVAPADGLEELGLAKKDSKKIWAARPLFLHIVALLLGSAGAVLAQQSAKPSDFPQQASAQSVGTPGGASIVESTGYGAPPSVFSPGVSPEASIVTASAQSQEQSSKQSHEQGIEPAFGHVATDAADPVNLIFYLEAKDGDLPITPQTPFSTFTHGVGYYKLAKYVVGASHAGPMQVARDFHLVPERLFATGLWADLDKNPKIALSELPVPKIWGVLGQHNHLLDFPVILRNKATKGPLLVQFPLLLGHVFVSGNTITLKGETAMDNLVVGVDASQYRGLTSGTRFGYVEHHVPTTLNIQGALWVRGSCLVQSALHIDGPICIGTKPMRKGLTVFGIQMYHSAVTADTMEGPKGWGNFGPNSTLEDVRDLLASNKLHKGGIGFYGNCALTFKTKAIAQGNYDLKGDGDAFISDIQHSLNNSIATLKNIHFAPTHLCCSYPTAPGKGYFDVLGSVDLTRTEICVCCVAYDIQEFTFDQRILLIQSTTPIQGRPMRVYVQDFNDFKDPKGQNIELNARLEIEGNKAYIVLSKKSQTKRGNP